MPRSLRAAALAAGLLASPLFGLAPAYANGAASTRNIIFGAAAAAGTLLIINHNKKVHQRYAEDAQRQAALEQQRDQSQAAYASERRAYENEVALVQSYQHEVAVQHAEIARERSQVASMQRQLALGRPAAAQAVASRPASQPSTGRAPQTVASSPLVVSYGWGDL